jgi:hypothetical protein
MSSIAARLDDIPKPAWIVLMVAGFIWWWPLGLATVAYLVWSGRMSCWRHGDSRWHEQRQHWRDQRDRMREDARRWWHGERAPASSGNRAFDEYREDTLRRLEEEQKEFRDFLDRLRHAKDKAEFDQFMADRRAPRAPTADREPPPPPREPGPSPSEPAR